MTLQRSVALALSVPLLAGVLVLAAPHEARAVSNAGVAQEEPLGDLKAVQEEALAKARELADFADSIKADIERDELYRCVLDYDSEDKVARKALGYTRSRNMWVFKRYTEPKNRAKDDQLAELQRRRSEALEELVVKLDACFPSESMSTRHKHELNSELAKIVQIDGNNAMLRQRAGHAWDEERSQWRMREVVAAKLDRAERVGLLKELDANVPKAMPAQTDEGGKVTGINWVSTFQVPRVLVSSTGTPEEVQRIVAIMHRAPDYLGGAFGVPDPWRDHQWRVYDMIDPDMRSQFYGMHPEVAGDRAQAAEAGSTQFGAQCIGMASLAPEGRYDMVATQRVGAYLNAVFGADLDKGWVRAGLGLFLSFQLCGTRLSLWIQRDEYENQSEGPTLGERLRDPTVDWLDEARLVLRRTNEPINLVALIGKPARLFTAEDLVVSYAIGAYLYEGRRRDLVQILSRLGKGETPVVVFESQLEMPIDAFRLRLIDWLAEMRKG